MLDGFLNKASGGVLNEIVDGVIYVKPGEVNEAMVLFHIHNSVHHPWIDNSVGIIGNKKKGVLN